MNIAELLSQKLARKHRKYTIRRKHIETCIDRLEKRIEKLIEEKHQMSAIHKPWHQTYVPELAKAIAKYFPGYMYDIGGPYGLGSRIDITFYKKHRSEFDKATDYRDISNSMYLVIVPISLVDGIIHYETGAVVNDYSPNSLGAVNGFNNVTKPIKSIEELVEHLKRMQDGQ
jgi:formylmethanofuran dehydrogenase subunit A